MKKMIWNLFTVYVLIIEIYHTTDIGRKPTEIS